ncbi:conserved hypothetical protein, secreted [Candidatus Magnetomorum sp. HK-1]|nr:conserved hypothetical protein, secreted [Candidatus Magnetomorum sp. HK-1]
MKKSILFTCVCVFLISSTGFAKMHGGGFSGDRLPPGKWWHMPKVAESLKLTAEEKTRLDTLFLNNRKAMISLKGEMATQRLDLEVIMEKENFDEAAAMDQFTTMQDSGQKMWKQKFQFLIEVRKLLGKDRFMQLKTQFQQHGGRHKMGKGMGRPGPDGDGEMLQGKGKKKWGWGQ